MRDRQRFAPNSSQSGFTLVELLTSVTVLAVMMAALGSVLISSQNVYREVTHSTQSDTDLRRTLDRVTTELRDAYPYSLRLTDTAGEPALSFVTIQGYGDDGPILGAEQNFEFRDRKVFWNGVAIAAEVESMAMTYDDNLLTITLRVQRGAISRELTATTRI